MGIESERREKKRKRESDLGWAGSDVMGCPDIPIFSLHTDWVWRFVDVRTYGDDLGASVGEFCLSMKCLACYMCFNSLFAIICVVLDSIHVVSLKIKVIWFFPCHSDVLPGNTIEAVLCFLCMFDATAIVEFRFASS